MVSIEVFVVMRPGTGIPGESVPGSLHRRSRDGAERPGGWVDDGTDDGEPDEPDEPEWPTSAMELRGLLAAVVGTAFEAEWAALRGPSAVPLRDSEVPGTYEAHVKADNLSHRFMGALRANGFSAAQFPQLGGKIDARGEPMMILGGVSAQTAEEVITLLMSTKRARDSAREPVTEPAGIRPAAGADGAIGVTFGVELDGRDQV